MSTIKKSLTVDQYDEMVEAGILPETNRFKLVEGRIVEKDAKSPVHSVAAQCARQSIEFSREVGSPARRSPFAFPTREASRRRTHTSCVGLSGITRLAIPTPRTSPWLSRSRAPAWPRTGHWPRRREVHDVPAELVPCPDCGALRVCIGEEVREQLEYVPACMMVIQHVRPKYACKACEGNVVIAERLPEPIEKGLPGPGLLAQVIVSKYADHLPLNRQEGILRRHGVELPRSTTCDWMAVCAGLLEPIVKQMHRQILQSRVIQTDDTPVTVLDKVKGRYQGRLWIYLGDRDHPQVVFDFTTDRSGAGPERMLKGYQGYLQADANSAYDRLYADGTIVEVGCWMHARRKFFEAKTSDPLRAHQALAWIRGLYAVEREAKTKELDDAQRLTLRQEQSRPILETIKEWLDKEVGQVLPKRPDGRGDRLRVEPLEGPGAVPGGGFPGDRQRGQRARTQAGGGGPEQLVVRGQRGRRQDGSDLDEPVRDVQASGDRPAGLFAGRAGADQHAPCQPDCRTGAGPVAQDSSGAGPRGVAKHQRGSLRVEGHRDRARAWQASRDAAP